MFSKKQFTFEFKMVYTFWSPSPAIVTIVLALSVSRMVRAKTIVRKLSSVETLGAVDVVWSDKTGTLTQNKMTVMECYIDGKMIDGETFSQTFTKELWEGGVDMRNAKGHFILGCILCNDANISGEGDFGDPTELALIHMARECAVPIEELRDKYCRKDEKGFDSNRKMMSTAHILTGSEGNAAVSYSKGAAEKILEGCDFFYQNGRKCAMSEADRLSLYRMLERIMDDGRRVLALAMEPDGEMY